MWWFKRRKIPEGSREYYIEKSKNWKWFMVYDDYLRLEIKVPLTALEIYHVKEKLNIPLRSNLESSLAELSDEVHNKIIDNYGLPEPNVVRWKAVNLYVGLFKDRVTEILEDNKRRLKQEKLQEEKEVAELKKLNEKGR